MVMLFLIAGLFACGETSPDTIVDELRVVASVANPPEVQPYVPFTFTSYAANPEDDDLQALTWVCTNFGDGCLEAFGGSTSLHTTELGGTAPDWERTLSASPALIPVLEESGALAATQLWTLVCTADTCPIIDEVGDADGTEEWPSDWQTDLANPLDWVADLPMEGVSLAYQLLTTSLSDAPHQNPTIEADEENPTELPRNDSYELTFTVDGDFTDQAQLYAYSSAGGFMTLNTFVEAGEPVTVEGTSPKSGDDIRVWMVLVDGNGGMDVWTSTFSLT
jgi:hypothetical protein